MLTDDEKQAARAARDARKANPVYQEHLELAKSLGERWSEYVKTHPFEGSIIQNLMYGNSGLETADYYDFDSRHAWRPLAVALASGDEGFIADARRYLAFTYMQHDGYSPLDMMPVDQFNERARANGEQECEPSNPNAKVECPELFMDEPVQQRQARAQAAVEAKETYLLAELKKYGVLTQPAINYVQHKEFAESFASCKPEWATESLQYANHELMNGLAEGYALAIDPELQDKHAKRHNFVARMEAREAERINKPQQL